MGWRYLRLIKSFNFFLDFCQFLVPLLVQLGEELILSEFIIERVARRGLLTEKALVGYFTRNEHRI
jgi:hypothetical protein